MSKREIQRRLRAGELAFLDGKYVIIRTLPCGYAGKAWHYTDPALCCFENDQVALLMEFIGTRWWSWGHARALADVLQRAGIALHPLLKQELERVRWN